MIRIILILLLFASPVHAWDLGWYDVASAVTCSGSFDSQYESFENSSSAPCTSGWGSVAGTAGIIDFKDTAFANCGSSSMSILGDSTTADWTRVQANITTADADAGFRYYLSVTSMANYTVYDHLVFRNASGTIVLTMRMNNDNGTYKVSPSTVAGEYFVISINTKYYITIDYNADATTSIKMYDSSGTPLASAGSGTDGTLVITTAGSVKSLMFQDAYNSATQATLYIDDLFYDSSAGDLSGGQTCN